MWSEASVGKREHDEISILKDTLHALVGAISCPPGGGVAYAVLLPYQIFHTPLSIAVAVPVFL
jgi:hypothetical protein